MNLFVLHGGIKGISFLGVLKYLYINNKLNNIKNMFGCSVGSVLITLFAIFKCPKKIYYILKKENNIIFSDNIVNDLSLFDLNKLINFTFQDFLPKHITISEFNKKYNCNVNYIVRNVTLNKSELFNALKTPNIKVYDAIKASCCIPVFFSPTLINNYIYVDGGVTSFYKLIEHYIHRDSIIIKQKKSDIDEKLMSLICRNVFAVDFKKSKYENITIKNLSNYEFNELYIYGIKYAYNILNVR